MRFKKFAGKNGVYEFPAQTDTSNNFGNVVTRTTRNWMMDGSIDEYGGRRAPQELGTVAIAWLLFGDNRGSIRKLKDAAFAMTGWGVQRLFIQPEYFNDGVRWAWGRINNIRGNENVSDLPHLREKMDANFQIAHPAWQGTVSKAWFLDTSLLHLDGGHHLDGMWYLDDLISLDTSPYEVMYPRIEYQVFGSASISNNNWGNHATRPVITAGGITSQWFIGDVTIGQNNPALYLGGVGGEVRSVKVKATYNGADSEEFEYRGVLKALETVTIDCAKWQVIAHKLTGDESGYADFTVNSGVGFLQIPPGDLKLTVTVESGEAGSYFAVEFFDAWY